MKKPKKRKKSSPLKKLMNIAETLWKLKAKHRDGNRCSLCESTKILQVDHCFSRTCKELFLEIDNATTLCASCHTKKSFSVHGFDELVREHVEKRVGKDRFEEMRAIYKKNAPFDWTFDKLEKKIQELA